MPLQDEILEQIQKKGLVEYIINKYRHNQIPLLDVINELYGKSGDNLNISLPPERIELFTSLLQQEMKKFNDKETTIEFITTANNIIDGLNSCAQGKTMEEANVTLRKQLTLQISEKYIAMEQTRHESAVTSDKAVITSLITNLEAVLANPQNINFILTTTDEKSPFYIPGGGWQFDLESRKNRILELLKLVFNDFVSNATKELAANSTYAKNFALDKQYLANMVEILKNILENPEKINELLAIEVDRTKPWIIKNNDGDQFNPSTTTNHLLELLKEVAPDFVSEAQTTKIKPQEPIATATSNIEEHTQKSILKPSSGKDRYRKSQQSGDKPKGRVQFSGQEPGQQIPYTVENALENIHANLLSRGLIIYDEVRNKYSVNDKFQFRLYQERTDNDMELAGLIIQQLQNLKTIVTYSNRGEAEKNALLSEIDETIALCKSISNKAIELKTEVKVAAENLADTNPQFKKWSKQCDNAIDEFTAAHDDVIDQLNDSSVNTKEIQAKLKEVTSKLNEIKLLTEQIKEVMKQKHGLDAFISIRDEAMENLQQWHDQLYEFAKTKLPVTPLRTNTWGGGNMPNKLPMPGTKQKFFTVNEDGIYSNFHNELFMAVRDICTDQGVKFWGGDWRDGTIIHSLQTFYERDGNVPESMYAWVTQNIISLSADFEIRELMLPVLQDLQSFLKQNPTKNKTKIEMLDTHIKKFTENNKAQNAEIIERRNITVASEQESFKQDQNDFSANIVQCLSSSPPTLPWELNIQFREGPGRTMIKDGIQSWSLNIQDYNYLQNKYPTLITEANKKPQADPGLSVRVDAQIAEERNLLQIGSQSRSVLSGYDFITADMVHGLIGTTPKLPKNPDHVNLLKQLYPALINKAEQLAEEARANARDELIRESPIDIGGVTNGEVTDIDIFLATLAVINSHNIKNEKSQATQALIASLLEFNSADSGKLSLTELPKGKIAKVIQLVSENPEFAKKIKFLHLGGATGELSSLLTKGEIKFTAFSTLEVITFYDDEIKSVDKNKVTLKESTITQWKGTNPNESIEDAKKRKNESPAMTPPVTQQDISKEVVITNMVAHLQSALLRRKILVTHEAVKDCIGKVLVSNNESPIHNVKAISTAIQNDFLPSGKKEEQMEDNLDDIIAAIEKSMQPTIFSQQPSVTQGKTWNERHHTTQQALQPVAMKATEVKSRNERQEEKEQLTTQGKPKPSPPTKLPIHGSVLTPETQQKQTFKNATQSIQVAKQHDIRHHVENFFKDKKEYTCTTIQNGDLIVTKTNTPAQQMLVSAPNKGITEVAHQGDETCWKALFTAAKKAQSKKIDFKLSSHSIDIDSLAEEFVKAVAVNKDMLSNITFTYQNNQPTTEAVFKALLKYKDNKDLLAVFGLELNGDKLAAITTTKPNSQNLRADEFKSQIAQQKPQAPSQSVHVTID